MRCFYLISHQNARGDRDVPGSQSRRKEGKGEMPALKHHRHEEQQCPYLLIPRTLYMKYNTHVLCSSRCPSAEETFFSLPSRTFCTEEERRITGFLCLCRAKCDTIIKLLGNESQTLQLLLSCTYCSTCLHIDLHTFVYMLLSSTVACSSPWVWS